MIVAGGLFQSTPTEGRCEEGTPCEEASPEDDDGGEVCWRPPTAFAFEMLVEALYLLGEVGGWVWEERDCCTETDPPFMADREPGTVGEDEAGAR